MHTSSLISKDTARADLAKKNISVVVHREQFPCNSFLKQKKKKKKEMDICQNKMLTKERLGWSEYRTGRPVGGKSKGMGYKYVIYASENSVAQVWCESQNQKERQT